MFLTSQRNIVVINRYKTLFSVHIWINNDKKWSVPVRNNTEKKDKQTYLRHWGEIHESQDWVNIYFNICLLTDLLKITICISNMPSFEFGHICQIIEIYIFFPFSSQCMQYDIFSLFVLFSLFNAVPVHSGICDCNHQNVFPKLVGIGKTRGF